MSTTITFVATDELAEWVETEAERRMTTISSTAQQLLAEKYREEQSTRSDADQEPDAVHQELDELQSKPEKEAKQPRVSSSEPSETTPTTPGSGERESGRSERLDSVEQNSESEMESEQESVHEQILAVHSEKWAKTRAGSENAYRVTRRDGKEKYYKTIEGTAARLVHDYGAGGVEIEPSDIQLGRIQGGNDTT